MNTTLASQKPGGYSDEFSLSTSDATANHTAHKNDGDSDHILTLLGLCQIANACFIFATIWVVLNLVLYLIKHRRRKLLPSSDNLDGRKMYAVCLGAVIFALPRLVMSQAMFYLPQIPSALPKCEILLDVLNAFYLIAVASTYGFLWYRQRTIYALPMIREMTGLVANILSWILIFIMLGSYLTLFCVFSIPDIYTWNAEGCTLKLDQSRNDQRARASRYYVITGVMVLWQITLVVLFVYPMILIKRSHGSLRRVRKHTSIKAGIKRAVTRSVVCATIAALSDVTTVTIAAFIPLTYPVFINTSLYDLSLQINIFCVITTFGDNVGLFSVCYYCAERSVERKRKKIVKLKLAQQNACRPKPQI